MAIIITDDPAIIEALERIVTHDYTDDEYDDYWYIAINPHQCTCGEYIESYCTFTHDHVIWEEKDDEWLLKVAIALQKVGHNETRVMKYNRNIGPCMEFYDALDIEIIPKVWE